MFRPLRWLVIATAMALPTAAAAQLQVNQNFITQGPAPIFGPTDFVGSADAPPNGNATGAIGPVIADPLNANRLFIGTVGGGIWTTTNGGVTWTPLTDKQASLSIASLSLDPTDPSGKTLIAGTGLTANGSVCFSLSCFFTGTGGLQNGLLYSNNGGSSWTSLGAAPLGGQTVDAVAARGNVLLAGTFEISGLGGNKNTGALYRSTNGGVTFTQISGAAGTGLPNGPVSSLAGDPNNPNRLYAAVTAPNTSAAANASTAIYASNDTGATWTRVFGKDDSGKTIQETSQTVIKIATGPSGAIAAGVVNLNTKAMTGLFWSGNSGLTWTPLATPPVNNGVVICRDPPKCSDVETAGPQAPVNFAIAIDPKNTNLVYVSGERTAVHRFLVTAFRIDAVNSPGIATSITDANTANVSTVHPDSRDLTFDANGRLILTSDGGIYARTNPGSNTGAWSSLNGNISVLQPYAVGYDAVGKRLIAAAQDNGVSIQSGRNNLLWNDVASGDGINAFVNDVTLAGAGQTAFYNNSQNLGAMSRIVLDARGNQISPNTLPPDDALGAKVTCNGIACDKAVVGTYFSSPWVNNRVDPTRMALGGSHVYVTQDTLTGAQGPAAANVDLSLTDLGLAGGADAQVTRIAYGTRDNPNMLVAGVSPSSGGANTPDVFVAGVASDGVGGLSAGQVWQSTTATAGSLVVVPAYTAAGGLVRQG
jgi:hypothetical protein